MVQPKITLVLLFSSISLCQASPFVYEDYFAYPRYTLELTEKKLPESSVFGHHQVRHIGQWNNQEHSNDEQTQVIMMTAKAQPFLCTIPTASATQSNPHSSFSTNANTKSTRSSEETQHTIDRGLELLKPLEKECLYYKPHGYWTYQYCHGRHVRQFHLDATDMVNDGDKILIDGKSSFILGTFPNQQQGKKNDGLSTDTNSNERWTFPQQQQRHDTLDKIQPPPPADLSTTTLQHMGGQQQQQQVLVQHWNGGTPCDITNQPRAIDIQFQCELQGRDRIAFLEEVSTCHYRMIIATPRLCDDLALGSKKQTKPHTIECNPIVPEHRITDHKQQQEEGVSMDQTTQQQQQQQQSDDDNPDTSTTTKQPMVTNQQEQLQQTTEAEKEDMAKSDLVGMISNLVKQVDQLQKSMEQQYTKDHRVVQQQQQQQQHQHQHQQQQQQQQTPVVFLDQHGQWVVAPSTALHQRDPGQTAQAFFKQLFSSMASSSLPANSFKQQQQQQLPSDESSGSQQQNRKAYEKTYYP